MPMNPTEPSGSAAATLLDSPNPAPASAKQKRNRKKLVPPQLGLAASSAFQLEQELFRIVSGPYSPEQMRQLFREVVLISTKSVGACHVIQTANQWSIAAGHSSGRAPRAVDIDDSLEQVFSKVAAGEKSLLLSLESVDGLPCVLTPVVNPSGTKEVFLLVTKNAHHANKAIDAVQKVAKAMQLSMRSHGQQQSVWELSALSAIMELVGKIENADNIQQAATIICNEAVRFLECDSVSVGVKRKSELELQAISRTESLDRTSTTSQAYFKALQESDVRGRTAVYPPVDEDNAHLLLAHKALKGQIHSQAVSSQPLLTSQGTPIGAWVFTGSQQQLQQHKFARFVDAASPHIADALALLMRAEKSKVRQKWELVKSSTSARSRQLIPLGLLATLLIMFIPIRYKVRCNCIVEPMARRFAVSPFDGTVLSGFAEPGDVVKQGDLLATMEGREIRLKLGSLKAELGQSRIQRNIEFHEDNIPQTVLSEFEAQRLQAEIEVLQHKQDHLQVRSPIDGVVLSGSLERSEAASVRTGETLFEIGPIDDMKVEIAIPAEDIAQVAVGDEVKIWVEGHEEIPLASTIQSIHPRSEIRDAENVFIASIEFKNENNRFRPGMKGAVRIKGQRRTLGWSLFHKPINYLRSRLTWW